MSNVFFAHTASHYRLTPLPCGYASLAIISRYSAKRSQFGHFQVCGKFSLSQPTHLHHHDECTLLNSITLGPGETRACSQTSRTNNGTLTISTALWVMQMRGLRNLYLSSPPLSLWVTLVYVHPLWVTLVYIHPPRVTHVYIHPPRVTHMFAYATPGSPQGYTGMSVLW